MTGCRRISGVSGLTGSSLGVPGDTERTVGSTLCEKRKSDKRFPKMTFLAAPVCLNVQLNTSERLARYRTDRN
jgi:hypothetical protein